MGEGDGLKIWWFDKLKMMDGDGVFVEVHTKKGKVHTKGPKGSTKEKKEKWFEDLRIWRFENEYGNAD